MSDVVVFKLVDNRLLTVVPKARAAAQRLVDTTATHVVQRILIEMQKPKHGVTYGRGVSKRSKGRAVAYRFHRASAPGEAPAIDTTALASSIGVTQIAPLTDEIAVGARYGWYLEMRLNRQFLGPAMQAEEPAFRAGVAKLVVL